MFLDDWDRKILSRLDSNARISTTTIGYGLRKSKQFVDYRINKLERSGVIIRYKTVINFFSLDYTIFKVLIKFHKSSSKGEKEMVKALQKLGSVSEFDGHYDLILEIKSNLVEFQKNWDSFYNIYSKYIKKFEILTQVEKSCYTKKGLEKKFIKTHNNTVKIKDIDKKILKLMEFNANITLTELARKCKTSVNVIKNHLNYLERNKIILGYDLEIKNENKTVLLNLTNVDFKKFEVFCKNRGEIERYERVSGRYNAVVTVNDRKVIDKIKDNFEVEVEVLSS